MQNLFLVILVTKSSILVRFLQFSDSFNFLIRVKKFACSILNKMFSQAFKASVAALASDWIHILHLKKNELLTMNCEGFKII